MKSNFRQLIKSFIVMGILGVLSKTVNAKDIVIYIENIDTDLPGNIMVMLYAKEGFPKNHAKALAVNVMPVANESIITTFSSVPAEFAIKVLHDEDDTGEVSKNWTGIIPAEGLGFSNGAKLRFGPPNFQSAKLIFDDINSPITISMIYP